jgi:hypothetical protein
VQKLHFLILIPCAGLTGTSAGVIGSIGAAIAAFLMALAEKIKNFFFRRKGADTPAGMSLNQGISDFAELVRIVESCSLASVHLVDCGANFKF